VCVCVCASVCEYNSVNVIPQRYISHLLPCSNF